MRTWTKPEAVANGAQPLLSLLSLYPLLENLVSHIQPDDLVTLTTVCQAVHAQIRMHEPQAKANLLTKTLCPGLGLGARLSTHCPCKTRGWDRFIGCGGDGYDVESKPCVTCGIRTCDECRIHCTYQVFMQENGLDNRRWWAGFCLMDPTPLVIYPPKDTDATDSTWHLPADLSKSHHDEGRFHIPLHVPAIADPEPLDRILDLNLGTRYVTPAGRTTVPYEGEHLVMCFQMTARLRLELVCPPCFEQHQAKEKVEPCSCTFRKRFLDRWLCVPCYKIEAASDTKLQRNYPGEQTEDSHTYKCRCEGKIQCKDDYRIICNWCKGGIDMDREFDKDDEDETAYTNHTEDDDSNAAAPPAGLGPMEMGVSKNKDGTVSAFLDGQRYSGERLGYNLLVREAIQNGERVPCSCCTCPGRRCQHSHGDSDDEDMDAVREDMDTVREDMDEEEDKKEVEDEDDAPVDDTDYGSDIDYPDGSDFDESLEPEVCPTYAEED